MGLLKGCGQNRNQLGSVKYMVINSGNLLCPLCCQGGQGESKRKCSRSEAEEPFLHSAVLLFSILTWAWRWKIVSVERSPRKDHHCPRTVKMQRCPSACGCLASRSAERPLQGGWGGFLAGHTQQSPQNGRVGLFPSGRAYSLQTQARVSVYRLLFVCCFVNLL